MKLPISSVIGFVALASPALAINISLDYSHSTSSFFDTGTTDGVIARAAVQAAADDLSDAITSSLNSLSNFSYSGSADGDTVNLTTSLNYTNPDTGASETFAGSLATDEFRIFVGARSLDGPTLGTGGPGGVGIGGGISGFPPDAQAAADIASANASAGMTRGGQVVSTLSGAFGGSFAGTSFSVDFGPTLGNLWFDNDGSTSWHLDHTTAVGSGSSDLYSVALHEIIHALGIGTSDSWDNQVSGTDWTGAEAIAEHGTGTNLIDSGGGHIEFGTTSTRLSDGAVQEVVMDPNLTVGTRKELTDLDLAFLRDIGWQTIPEPSSSALFGMAGLAFVLLRRRS